MYVQKFPVIIAPSSDFGIIPKAPFLASILESNIIYPDLIIFLQSDTERLMNNIKKRGRKYENSINWTYLDALNQIYNEYFFRYDKGPLVIINTNDIDFVNNQNDLQICFPS